MYELALYSLRTGACLAVFYLFFKLLLSRETFHRLNRVVVLVAVLLSFVLPLCVITVYREMPAMPALSALPFVPDEQATSVEPVVEPVAWQPLLGALFVAGVVAALAAMLVSLACVLRIIYRGRHEQLEDGSVLVHTVQAVSPFSWGRYIVLPDKDADDNLQAILLHERAHRHLHHSWDLLLIDVVGCLQWFNPAMWLLRRELQAIHEYEADEAVLRCGVDARTYQLLLVRKSVGARWYSVVNSFNHSNLKNRINMMLCKKSSRLARTKIVVLLPLTALALGAFAQTAYVFPDDKTSRQAVMTVRIDGTDSVELQKDAMPFYVVNGQTAETIDDLDPEQVSSVTILKNGADLTEKYGERAKNGVVLITTKGHESDENAGDGVTLKTVDSDLSTVTVGRIDGKTVSITSTTAELGEDGSKRMILIDGKPYLGELNDLNPNVISTITVDKSGKLYNEYKASGNDAVISITTHDAAASAKAGLDAGLSAIESAREKLNGEQYDEARQQLDKAYQQLHEAQAQLRDTKAQRKEQLADANKQLEKAQAQLKGKVTNVSSTSVVTSSDDITSVVLGNGSVDFKTAITANTKQIYVVNGKEVSAKEFGIFWDETPDVNINIYKGDEAVKRFGRKGRNGVVEATSK